ncbi:MAG: adenosylcobinamide-phosphate synthase CbiB [Dissulfurispiraceae bacterium]|jgi:adenosylcobinamide-phosphate synthase|nr:adenosylcobinamide-phosphate synthase CbiB [Dissulfurispiraceae bacterium]
MITSAELLSAFLLDLFIGDPERLPHPVRIIGRWIEKAELFLRKICSSTRDEKSAGVILAAIVVIPSYAFTWLLNDLLRTMSGTMLSLISSCFIIWLISTTIALHGLISSAKDVVKTLLSGDVFGARKKLSMIVGRDTQELSEKDILKAVIETVSENLNDGIIAPFFYLVLGGLPLAMAYKAVNTLDSMVGYKNEKYRNLGFASAKLDDLLNYIPARITGLLIVSSVFMIKLISSNGFNSLNSLNAFKIMWRDGGKHPSPNSGIPEAAMAGALGVRLGGSSIYNSNVVKKEYIGEEITMDYASASMMSITIIKTASLVALIISAAILGMRSGL